MNKLALILSGLFLLLCCNSCDDDSDDAALLFSVEQISEEPNVTINYSSPDPGCVPPMYYIDANCHASRLSIKCTNATSISFCNRSGELSYEYICEEGHWRAEIVNSNTINFTFDQIDPLTDDADQYLVADDLCVVSQTPADRLRTGIYVTRLLLTADPL